MSRGRSVFLMLVVIAFAIGVVAAIAEAARRSGRRRPNLQLVPSTSTSSSEPATWVLPQQDRCPTGFPVKVKESSGIFHVPGGAHYERVHPDRCYTSADAATADGFRRSRT